MRWCAFVIVAFPSLVAAQLARTDSDRGPQNRSSTARQDRSGDSRAGEYAPGVRIDWGRRRVEIAAKVVLREGPLELFACSPQTREHESIVVVTARPLRIYEALGLIGLNAGRPTRYDRAANRWSPATGDRVAIEARWTRKGETITVDIGEWMKDLATGKNIAPNVWVFSGSFESSESAFAADAEGTVICVVDFSSALIALPELHTSANEALWISADPAKIPVLGTSVTLTIGAADAVEFDIHIGPKGVLTYGGKVISMKRLVERIERFQRDHRSTAIVIHAHPNAPRQLVERVEETIRLGVVPGTEVRVSDRKERIKLDHAPPPGDSERP